MISIYCGNDTAGSRRVFNSEKEKITANSRAVPVFVNQSNIYKVLQSSIHERSLFADRPIYLAENILSRKKIRDTVLEYESNPNTHMLIWEESMDPRSIKTYFKKSKINVTDLPVTIWKLLDSILPGKKSDVISYIRSISGILDEHLLLFMIQKRIKELIMIHRGLSGGKKLADWQASRLKQQARQWQQPQLLSIYSKFSAIEKAERIDSTPYTITQALEILFCFYL